MSGMCGLSAEAIAIHDQHGNVSDASDQPVESSDLWSERSISCQDAQPKKQGLLSLVNQNSWDLNVAAACNALGRPLTYVGYASCSANAY